jgi:PHD/YefM family antitoxin component YafN of YafNO toxin-antitoxin module
LLELARATNDNGEAFVLTKDGASVSALIPMNEYEAFLETMEIEEDPALMRMLDKSLRDVKAGRLWTRDKSGKWRRRAR